MSMVYSFFKSARSIRINHVNTRENDYVREPLGFYAYLEHNSTDISHQSMIISLNHLFANIRHDQSHFSRHHLLEVEMSD